MYGGVRLASHEPVCNATSVVPCPNLAQALQVNTRVLPDGPQTSHPGAGLRIQLDSSPVAVPVDNTATGATDRRELVGGSDWRQQNAFSVTWRNPSQTGTAPIAGIETAICPATNDAERLERVLLRARQQAGYREPHGLQVPGAGEWVGRFWLRDAAGNEMPSAQTVRLRLDDSPPVVRFKPVDDADPTRIDVQASDSTSPLARTELEIRRRGKHIGSRAHDATADGSPADWTTRTSPTASTTSERGRLTAPATSSRPTLEISGDAAARRVPERINTRLVAGQVKHVTARRSRGGRRRTRRVIVVRPTVPYGHTIPIRGRLTMPGGNPVADGAVEVWEHRRSAGAVWRRIALIGTDAAGRFKFKALRGPSRVLRFRYPGTALVRARTTEVEIKVTATSTLRPVARASSMAKRSSSEAASSAAPPGGREARPASGLLARKVADLRHTAGQRHSGRWSYRYRFTATRGTVSTASVSAFLRRRASHTRPERRGRFMCW